MRSYHWLRALLGRLTARPTHLKGNDMSATFAGKRITRRPTLPTAADGRAAADCVLAGRARGIEAGLLLEAFVRVHRSPAAREAFFRVLHEAAVAAVREGSTS